MTGSRDDELRELEAALDQGDGSSLSEEIAQRWDPERLLKLISRRAGSGRSLDAMTRAKYERRLGVDLAGVRIFSGEFAERITKAHSAEAVTVGSTGMILMSGRPDRSPLTTAGSALLAHELTHVAQAKGGLHRSATDRPLATEADDAKEAQARESEQEEFEAVKGPTIDEPDPAVEAAFREQLFARVLELLEENERVWVDRNGDHPGRP